MSTAISPSTSRSSSSGRPPGRRRRGRPQDNPLILHIPDASWLSRYCHDVPASACALAERFWPGPLTMILPRREIVPDAYDGVDAALHVLQHVPGAGGAGPSGAVAAGGGNRHRRRPDDLQRHGIGTAACWASPRRRSTAWGPMASTRKRCGIFLRPRAVLRTTHRSPRFSGATISS